MRSWVKVQWREDLFSKQGHHRLAFQVAIARLKGVRSAAIGAPSASHGVRGFPHNPFYNRLKFQDAEKGYRAGATAVFPKPMTVDHLLKFVIENLKAPD